MLIQELPYPNWIKAAKCIINLESRGPWQGEQLSPPNDIVGCALRETPYLSFSIAII